MQSNNKPFKLISGCLSFNLNMALLSRDVLYPRLWLDHQQSRPSLRAHWPADLTLACVHYLYILFHYLDNLLCSTSSWHLRSLSGRRHLLIWDLRSLECRWPCPFLLLLLHLKCQVLNGKSANSLSPLAPRRLRV